MQTDNCRTVPLTSLSLSPLNPRKIFDAGKISELAQTLKTQGLLQPLTVRPVKAAGQLVKGMYEVIDGARRFKAAEAADLSEMLVHVVDVDDAQAAQMMIAANDQREDLSPLERADGYRQLRDGFGMSVDDIAAKVGKSTKTVKRSLQLLNLAPETRKALEDGRITSAVAQELALVPGPIQAKALKEVERPDKFNGSTMHAVDVAAYLAEDFMHELKSARFDTKDAKLVPHAGACTTCPSNSATQPELFADSDAKAPARCTNLHCWRDKENAWLKQQTASGKKMLTAAEAKKVFAYGNDQVDKYRGDYVEADAEEYDPSTGKSTPVRKMLGKEADAAIVFARAPSGALVELVAKDAIPKPDVKSGKKAMKVSKKSPEELKRERQLELDRRTVKRVVQLLAEHTITANGEDNWLKLLAANFARELHQESKRMLANWLNLKFETPSDAEKALLDHAYRLEGSELRGFLVALAFSSRLALSAYDMSRMEPVKAACKRYGLDYGDYSAAVAKEMKEEERTKATAKKEKKAAKKGAKA